MDKQALLYDTTSYSLVKKIASFIDCPNEISILDPACGNGYAIADLKKELQNEFETEIHLYGIEFDTEFGNRAKESLTRLGRGRFEEARISHGSFSSCYFIHQSTPWSQTLLN